VNISNATFLVTGANRGIGAALVSALQRAGARKIYATARDPDSITASGVTKLRLDVTDAAQVAAAVRSAPDVTVLINNAGATQRASLLDSNAVTAARELFETNTFGVLALSNAFAPVLKANGGGTIVNILSALSWVVVGTTGLYSATKAATWAITNGLRLELKPQGTHVLGVHFGYVDTDMTKGVTAPKESPHDIADRIVAAVSADEAELLADQTAKMVKQGLTAPRSMYLGAG
jgi:NAD(P)-dependent dehydrogenase (short-subunit alcohol dehydrogenase family)